MLGTNPIAFSAPTDEEFPFTFDAATSIAPRGRIEVAARAGKPIPAGWVVREDGSLATDSTHLIEELNRNEAALLPLGGSGEMMGGHKGYGLATMVEIFSAAFQDGAFLSELHDTDKEGKPHFLSIGHFFLALNVEHFVPLGSFRKTAGSIVRELRASRKAPGEERIYTAGEKAHGRPHASRPRGWRSLPACSGVSMSSAPSLASGTTISGSERPRPVRHRFGTRRSPAAHLPLQWGVQRCRSVR